MLSYCLLTACVSILSSSTQVRVRSTCFQLKYLFNFSTLQISKHGVISQKTECMWTDQEQLLLGHTETLYE